MCISGNIIGEYVSILSTEHRRSCKFWTFPLIPSFSSSVSLEQYDSLVSFQGGLHFCRQCGYVTKYRPHMKAHLCKHTGERHFKCDVCPAAFRDSASLRKHVRTHTGERPFSCVHCGVSFTLKHHLTRHMERFHADKKL
ncbi:AT-rich binding protein isoform X4 [Rhipicephalus microplus]|uniref:AT-rich binding protein isoform X4 n=1 Tax=Rhipicephalus microplus TaxID=6941 RepID=UPI003F6B35C1